MSKAKSAPTVKVVGSGDSIEVQIPREAIQQVADEYGLSYDEALRDVLQTGIDEKLAVIEMLREEGDISEREDGAHRVHPYYGGTDDDEDDELPDWDEYHGDEEGPL